MNKMEKEQQQIWDFLLENALGINNAIHIKDIAIAIGVSDHGTNNDDVRNWIKGLVIDHERPIGTCKNGAFIVLDQDELEAAVRFVNRNQRTEAIRRNGTYNPLR